VDSELVRRLVDSLEGGDDAVVPVVEGVPQPLAAAYTTRASVALDAAFAAGERSPTRALDAIPWRALTDVAPESVSDVDDPTDLARYASEHTDPDSHPR
jgi:molybdopterin-guanine dinucleotide biosynthesis protein A